MDSKKADGLVASAEAVAAISKANSDEDFAKREKVYDKHRLEIQHHFR